MINVEPCPGCGRNIVRQRIANLDVKIEPVPLDAQQVVAELLSGGSLWTNDNGTIRPARPGEPGPAREHRCPVTAQEALSRPPTPSPGPSPQPTPSGPPADRTAPFSGPSAAPSSVPNAETPASDTNPRCEDCGLIMADGDFVSAQLGEIYIWAIHLTSCGENRQVV